MGHEAAGRRVADHDGAPGYSSTPEAATATRLPLRAERGGLIETAAWATKQERAGGRSEVLGLAVIWVAGG
jgi:hypothetical protein